MEKRIIIDIEVDESLITLPEDCKNKDVTEEETNKHSAEYRGQLIDYVTKKITEFIDNNLEDVFMDGLGDELLYVEDYDDFGDYQTTVSYNTDDDFNEHQTMPPITVDIDDKTLKKLKKAK